MGTTININDPKYVQFKIEVRNGTYQKLFDQKTGQSALIRETSPLLKKLSNKLVPEIIIDLWVNPETFFDIDKIEPSEINIINRYAAEDWDFYNHLARELPHDKFQMLLFSTASNEVRLIKFVSKSLKLAVENNKDYGFSNEASQKFVTNPVLAGQLFNNPNKFGLSDQDMANLIINAPVKSGLKLHAEKLLQQEVKKNAGSFRTWFSKTVLGKLFNVKPSTPTLHWFSELTKAENTLKEKINSMMQSNENGINLLREEILFLNDEQIKEKMELLVLQFNTLKNHIASFANSAKRLNDHNMFGKQIDILMAKVKGAKEIESQKQLLAEKSKVENLRVQLETSTQKNRKLKNKNQQLEKTNNETKEQLLKVEEEKQQSKEESEELSKKLVVVEQKVKKLKRERDFILTPIEPKNEVEFNMTAIYQDHIINYSENSNKSSVEVEETIIQDASNVSSPNWDDTQIPDKSMDSSGDQPTENNVSVNVDVTQIPDKSMDSSANVTLIPDNSMDSSGDQPPENNTSVIFDGTQIPGNSIDNSSQLEKSSSNLLNKNITGELELSGNNPSGSSYKNVTNSFSSTSPKIKKKNVKIRKEVHDENSLHNVNQITKPQQTTFNQVGGRDSFLGKNKNFNNKLESKGIFADTTNYVNTFNKTN